MNPLAVFIIGLLALGCQSGLALWRAKRLTATGRFIVQISLAVGWSIFAFASTSYAGNLVMRLLISVIGSVVVEVVSNTINAFDIFQDEPEVASLPAVQPVQKLPA